MVGPSVDMPFMVVLDCISPIAVLEDMPPIGLLKVMPSVALLEDMPAIEEDEVDRAVVVVRLFMLPGLEVIIVGLDVVDPPMLPILDDEVEVVVVIGVAVTTSSGEMRIPPT